MSDPTTKNRVIDADAALNEELRVLGLSLDDGKTNLGRPAALCLSGGGIRSAAFSLGVIQALAQRTLLQQFHYLSTVSGGGYVGGWLTRLIACEGEATPGEPQPTEGDDRGNEGQRRFSLAEVEAKLVRGQTSGTECDEIVALRRYTNYLAPRLGPASADLWAGVMLWLRNTLINWFVFVPLLIVIVTLPIIYFSIVGSAALTATALSVRPDAWYYVPPYFLTIGLGTIALVFLGIAIFRSILDLPTHIHPDRRWQETRRADIGFDDVQVFWRIVTPALIWCLLVPAVAAPILKLQEHPLRSDVRWVFGPEGETPPAAKPICTLQTDVGTVIAIVKEPSCKAVPEKSAHAVTPSDPGDIRFAAIAFVAIFATSSLAYFLALLEIKLFDYKETPENRAKHVAPFKRNIGAWVFSSLVSAGLIGLGIYLAAGASLFIVVLVGPLWVLLSDILRSSFYVAFRRKALRGDLDREWLARLSGVKLSVVAVMAAVGTAVLLVPSYVLATPEIGWSTLLGGGAASGSAAALLGKSATSMVAAKRPDGGRWVRTSTLISIAIVAFAAALVIVAGRAVANLVWLVAEAGASRVFGVVKTEDIWKAELAVALVVGMILAPGALILTFQLGKWINLNHFSMHAVYRNRLVRAFLGTARPKGAWRPDRFTHFDPNDNLRMANTFALWQDEKDDLFSRRSPPRLFPVVNVALNSTSGRDTARAERKAASFTITPLRCGSAALRSPATGTNADDAPVGGAYAWTRNYAGSERETGPGDKRAGISLGTAITISGAAASPNMGYHSSPLTAFIMTLFNVRLGAWLPNPGSGDKNLDYLANSDADSIGPILAELAGRSDDRGKYVYLSDGGHFDNLALYEMLRRRCEYMIVVDAGQDENYVYADLRRAIQYASIDVGVEITFIKTLHIGQKNLSPIGALAEVTYLRTKESEAIARMEDGRLKKPSKPSTGLILYLKPWLPEDSPAELRAFKAERKSFPHETTGNQFFSESDFESYRSLGFYLAKEMIDSTAQSGAQTATIAALFESLRTQSKRNIKSNDQK